MNVYELLKELGALGIKLWLEDGELKFRAPKGALTKAHKAKLKENKPAIIEFLRSTKTGAAAAAQIIQPVDRGVPIALSYAQQRLWFLDQLSPGDISYNIPVQLLLRGALKPAVFDRVFSDIIDRHEVLRTTFSGSDDGLENEEPSQTVQPFEGWTLPFYDLSGESEVNRLKRLNQLVEENVAQPFDLQNGPLFRIALIKLREEEFQLLATLHHIISDGWSMGVLVQEVIALYQAYSFELASPLNPLPIQYGDFAVWQRGWLSGEVLQSQSDYWQQQLSNVPKLELPTDKVRPAVLQFHGTNYEFEWDKDLVAQLHGLSQQQGVTLFMTLLAAFNVLLYRYTGQEDFAVGTPIANRTRPELEPIIGFFVNTIALRTDLAGAPSFIELLQRVQKTTLDGYSHQDLPFERVVEVTGVEREMSHTPLFQVMFVLQNASATEFKLPGLSIEGVATERLTSKFDLQLSFAESDQGLKGEIEYSTDLFDVATIENFANQLRFLVGEILKNPHCGIDQLHILPEQDQQKIIQEWNNTATAYPKDATIAQLFEQQVCRTPAQPALAGPQGDFSYQQLNGRANQLAHALAHHPQLTLTEGTPIGLCLERGAEQIIAILAVLKAGGVFVPLDPSYPTERLAYMVDVADVEWVLTSERLQRVTDSLACQVFLADGDFTEFSASNFQLETNGGIPPGERLAYVMFTSGSTGQPKGIEVRQQGVVRLVKDNAFFPFQEQHSFLQYAPVSFDASTFEIWGALLNGGRLVIPPAGPVDHQRLKQIICEYQVSTVWLTAALFHQVAEYELALLRPLKYLLAGGDVLAPSLVQKVLREIPSLTVINGYGPTENTTFTCCHVMESVEDVGRSVAIGKPISNTQVYLLDAHLQPVPVGVMGQIYTAGGGVAKGYLKQPALTAQAFIDNPFKDCAGHGERMYATGDYGRYQADGTLEFLGRVDGQVKIRGFRIELGEVEASLMRLPWIKQCVVEAKTGADGEKLLAAYWVAEDGEQQALIEKTKHQLAHSMPDYMLPAAHVVLQALPVNDNGKVDRRALPEVEFKPQESVVQAPRNPVETELVGIWQDLLGMSQVGIFDRFFDLGGHSLLATQVTSRIRRRWQVDIPLRTFFENPVIAALAEVINKDQSSEHQAEFNIEKLAAHDPIPASFAQKRLWLLDQLQPGSAAYNIPSAFRVRGALEVTLMAQAVTEVIQRHDALRTTFVQQGEQLFQKVNEVVSFQLLPEVFEDLDGGFDLNQEKIKQICHGEAMTPFNLTTGPLYRFRLIKLNAQDFIALVTLHHIISDGWSMGIFIQELTQRYQGLQAKQSSHLAPLDIQYGDYAAWQQSWMADERLEGHLDFYQQALAANDLVLRLPVDKPRPRFSASAGQTVGHALSTSLSMQLTTLAQREGVSLYMLMLAAWQVQLGRYSGQTHFNIGSPVAGRTREETEALIGFFINTVVLSANLSNNPSFRALLYQTRDNVLATFEYQDLPFEKLVEKLQPPRDLSRSPVFQVFLNVLNLPGLSGEVGGLLIEDLAEEEAEYESKFDLTLYVKEKAEGIHLSMLYRTDLFDQQTIQNQLLQLETLLEQIVVDIEAPIHCYRLSQEQPSAWLAANASSSMASSQVLAVKPQPQQLFEQCAQRDPKQVAIEDLDGAWYYGDLDRYANQLANAIVDAGLGAGDCVGIYGHRSGSLVWAVLGVLKSGAAFTILDPGIPTHRLMSNLDQVPLSGAIEISRGGSCPEVLAARFSALPFNVSLPGLNEAEDANPCAHHSSLCPALHRDENELAYVSFTSGTTGQAKAIHGALRPLSHFVAWYSAEFNITPEDRFSQLSGLGHDPFLRDVLVPLANHGTVYMPPAANFDAPEKMRAWMRDKEITVCHLTPSLLRLLNIGRTPQESDLAALRLIFFGGEALLLSHVREAQGLASKARCFNCYGATETPQIITYHEVAASQLAYDDSYQDQVMPVGQGTPGSQLVLLDGQQRPVGVGELGEVWVYSAYTAMGYGDAALTEQAFYAEPAGWGKGVNPLDEGPDASSPKVPYRWYRTGDLGRQRHDGDIEVMGRGDSQVKVRGYRVELMDVQNELRAMEQVRDCFVAVDLVSAPDASSELDAAQFVVAYLVAEAGRRFDADDFRCVASSVLPDYMLPNQFIFVEDIPLNQNGKVDRSQLPKPVWFDSDNAVEVTVLPRSPSEQKLVAIWSRLLKQDALSVTSNFFELGGHSLLATELVNLVQGEFAIELPLKAIFEFPSVEKLAAYIDTLEWAQQPAQQVPQGDDREELEI